MFLKTRNDTRIGQKERRQIILINPKSKVSEMFSIVNEA